MPNPHYCRPSSDVSDDETSGASDSPLDSSFPDVEPVSLKKRGGHTASFIPHTHVAPMFLLKRLVYISHVTPIEILSR